MGMSKLYNYKLELPEPYLPDSCSIKLEEFAKDRLQYIKPDQTIDILDQAQGIGSAQIYFYDSADAISIKQSRVSSKAQLIPPVTVYAQTEKATGWVDFTLKFCLQIIQGKNQGKYEAVWSELVKDIVPGDKLFFYLADDDTYPIKIVFV
jgi:hypothetical protein